MSTALGSGVGCKPEIFRLLSDSGPRAEIASGCGPDPCGTLATRRIAPSRCLAPQALPSRGAEDAPRYGLQAEKKLREKVGSPTRTLTTEVVPAGTSGPRMPLTHHGRRATRPRPRDPPSRIDGFGRQETSMDCVNGPRLLSPELSIPRSSTPLVGPLARAKRQLPAIREDSTLGGLQRVPGRPQSRPIKC